MLLKFGSFRSDWSSTSIAAGALTRVKFTPHLSIFVGLLFMPRALIGAARGAINASACTFSVKMSSCSCVRQFALTVTPRPFTNPSAFTVNSVARVSNIRYSLRSSPAASSKAPICELCARRFEPHHHMS